MESGSPSLIGAGESEGGGKILALPDDVLVRILRRLDPRDVLRFGAVCRRFLATASEDRLVWAPVCQTITGTAAATSAADWGTPSFKILYCRLLRTYGGLLSGPWCGAADPLGSLLVAFPSPPYIVGAIVVCQRLSEPGVSVVPVFRVSYDAQHAAATVSCLRGTNTFTALLRNVRQQHRLLDFQTPEPPEADEDHSAELQLTFRYRDVVPSSATMNAGTGSQAAEYSGGGGASGSEVQSGPHNGALMQTNGDELGSNGAAAAAAAAAAAVGGGGDTGAAGSSDGGDIRPSAKVDMGVEVEVDVDVGTAAGGSGGDVRGSAGTGPPPPGGPSGVAPERTGRRLEYYCWRYGGAELTQFSFDCSGGCRHTEVEAVCRWAPKGLMDMPLTGRMSDAGAAPLGANVGGAAIARTRDAAASSPTCGAGPTSGRAAAAPAAPAAAASGGGDVLIDLDIPTTYGLGERVQWAAMTLAGLMDRNVPRPVSYSRLRVTPASEPMPEAAVPEPGFGGADPLPGPAALGSPVPTAAQAPAVQPTTATGGEGSTAGGAAAVPRLSAASHPLLGVWRGTYGGHGMEFVQIQWAGPNLLEARKLTGDNNVPSRNTSFRVFLDRPGSYGAKRGSPFRLPPDYASRADVSGAVGRSGSAGPQREGGGGEETQVLDAFEAEGQVAGSGYRDPQWISAELLVLGRVTFGVLWHDIRSFSAFRRMHLPEGYPVP